MKYALITGASSGIGLELAKVFGYNGYTLIINGSDAKRLEDARDFLERVTLAEVHPIVIDLTEKGAARTLHEKTCEITENVDILINNAGFGLIGASDKTDMDREEQMLMLSVINTTLITRLFYADMKKKGAGIVWHLKDYPKSSAPYSKS